MRDIFDQPDDAATPLTPPPLTPPPLTPPPLTPEEKRDLLPAHIADRRDLNGARTGRWHAVAATC